MLVDGLSANRHSADLSSLANYQLHRCPLEFDRATAGASLVDLAAVNGFIVLELEPLTWLLNIRLGYHVFRKKIECWIEQYTPSRFALQFRYD